MDGEKLEITRLLAAPPEKVFEAWTDAGIVARWFAPGNMTAKITELDAQPGGQFRIEMSDPEGATHTAVGTYEEVATNSRLVFSWGWEGSPTPQTQVTVELNPAGGKTEMVLIHSGFPSAEARDQHMHGWSGSTAKLEALFASVDA